MSITIHCDCGKTFNVGDDLADRRVRCPACKEVHEVRAAGPRQPRRPRDYDDDDEPRQRRRPRDYEEDDEPRQRRRKQPGGAMWLIIGGVCLLLLLVGGAVTAILLTVGGSGSSDGGQRGDFERRPAINNLKQLGLAMHNYHDVYRQLPSSSGNTRRHPGLSWRVDLLPFLEYDNLHRQIRLNEPYDSPHNRQFWSQMPKVYASPGTDPTQGKTRYQIFTGPNTPFSGPRPTLAGITDGTSNTIMIAEAATEVNWMAPEDIPFKPSPGGFPASNLGPPNDTVFLAVFCDGSTRELPRTINPVDLQHLIMSNDGNLVSPP